MAMRRNSHEFRYLRGAAAALLAITVTTGPVSLKPGARGGWLQEFLADGSRPAKEVVSQARECGISARTLERAKAVLGIRSEKRQFDSGSGWFWSLEGAAGDAHETVAIFENAGGLR